MTGRERESRRLHTLIARIGEDWRLVQDVGARLSRVVSRARNESADELSVAAVALYLQHMYSSIEELFRRIAVEVDGAAPESDDWHRELIEQMSLTVQGVRPAMIDREMQSDLDLLRRFRHLVRHAYAAEYDWAEMQPVIAASERVLDLFPTTIARFNAFLESLIETLDQTDSR